MRGLWLWLWAPRPDAQVQEVPYWRVPQVRQMSDFLSDTPIIPRAYCPTCEPDADPVAQVLDMRYCHLHDPRREGDMDRTVDQSQYLSGGSEAGGAENAAFCAFIHRGRK